MGQYIGNCLALFMVSFLYVTVAYQAHLVHHENFW